MFVIAEKYDIASCADNISKKCVETTDVILKIEKMPHVFLLNKTKGNPDKCHPMIQTTTKRLWMFKIYKNARILYHR